MGKVLNCQTRKSRGNGCHSWSNQRDDYLFVEADVAAWGAAVVHFLLVVIVEVIVVLVRILLLALVLAFFVFP